MVFITQSFKEEDRQWMQIRGTLLTGVLNQLHILQQALTSDDNELSIQISKLFVSCAKEFKAELSHVILQTFQPTKVVFFKTGKSFSMWGGLYYFNQMDTSSYNSYF